MMKNSGALVLIVGVQIVLVVVHIHTTSRWVQESYQDQHNRAIEDRLTHEKQVLLCTLNELKNCTAIKEFARAQLGMTSITLKQVNKLVS